MSEPLLLIEPREATIGVFDRLKAVRLRTQTAIRDALTRHGRKALWIAPTASAVRMLLGILPHRPMGDQRLLSLERADGKRHGLLHVLFRFVISVDEGVCLLPTEELVEALASDDRSDLFIGTAPADGAVILYRGNLEPLVVPLTWFRTRTGGPKPDVLDLTVTDFGQTIRLGKYEAATDAILYEFDEQYRRHAKKRALAKDRSFGGALRRLRLQKGLSQADFPGVTAKEIARIERGEVKKPRQQTLVAIAKRMDVAVEAIESY